MRHCVRILAAVLVGLAALTPPPGAGTGAARAETTAQLSGSWTIGDDFSDIHCDVHLSEDRAGAGFAVAFATTCRTDFPVLAGVAAWRPDGHGGVVLVDAAGASIVDYAVSETESLLSVAPGALMLRMTPQTVDPTTVGAIFGQDGDTLEIRPGIY